MAFPTVQGRATTNGTTGSTSAVVNLPSGIVSGELLVGVFRSTGDSSHTWPGEGTDWIQLYEDATDAADDRISAAYRIADGTEGATITITKSGTGKFAAITHRISGWHGTTPPEFATLVTGTSATPDPGSLSPSWGAEDTLWIWSGGWEGEQTSPPAGNPTNYSNPTGANSGTAGAIAANLRVATAERNLNAASEDPPSWTISVSDDWTVTVIAVRPATPRQERNCGQIGAMDTIFFYNPDTLSVWGIRCENGSTTRSQFARLAWSGGSLEITAAAGNTQESEIPLASRPSLSSVSDPEFGTLLRLSGMTLETRG